MVTTSSSPPSLLLLLVLFFPSFMLSLFFSTSMVTAKVTDPTEEEALNTIFRRWGITAPSSWNISGDPCSGAAFEENSINKYNPVITCVCDCDVNNTQPCAPCYVDQLIVSGLNATGQIPQELRFFKRMVQLDLRMNYLTGPVPAFFGNFTYLENLFLHTNDLSGPFPKEFGNLKNLNYLSIGTNNFSGTIPPELGGMINLGYWYMDSAGFSGDLPSELANLKNLRELWLSDNSFTGKLPSFFGSFTNLTNLKMQGNSFQGPIPASFSKLTKMIDLRIGDVINGSSDLRFISNMTSLTTLILRNCKISGALPSNFSKYSNLQELDLSFNNITGLVPQSLLNLNHLRFLFLGNNSLSGSLPAQKSSSLTSVDLSYNELAGSFPSWVAETNLQLNLVANNFVINDSNNSALPSGLNCLQNDKPCYRDSPTYSSFAVNCGGSRSVTASDNITYDMDNAYLTSASYYVTNPAKWAVSSVGTVLESPSSVIYELTGSWKFNKTLDTELFQTSRLSPSSLRYYGLGLENGNYTVKLQFAETQFIDGPASKNVGKRIFDIYIQGDLKEKDFDIRKEAGGSSFTAVVKEYTAPVTNNFLEIHFFWAGRGTWSVPYQGYYGPSISAISASAKVTNKPPSSSSTNHIGLAVGLAVGGGVITLALLCLALHHFQRKNISNKESYGDLSTLYMNVKPDNFSYTEIKTATDDFSSSNRLGEGGYGPVFKGILSDGRVVAVKQLSVTSHQGKHQFLTEIATISAVQHFNLVKLLGYCVEGDKHILVYEFLENKSLDRAIFGKSRLHLDWPKRLEICMGVARGLAYLHEESSTKIVHRDVKASNILLDADMNPKISDFGLAKLYDEKKTHMSTKIAGTLGYLAPEYAMRGHLTKKADVYAFGVLCLEILAGRPNFDQRLETEKMYLLEWAWCLHENKRDLELVDGSLSSFNEVEISRVVGVSFLCTQASPARRPLMSRVVAMLAGDVEVPEVAEKPSYLDWQYYKDETNNHVTPQIPASTPSDADSLMNSFMEEGR